MSVKRYSLTFSGALVVSQDGGMVDYEDYAALEVRCAVLAAENARCKFEVSRCHQTVDEMFKNREKWIDKEWLSSIWSTSKRLIEETPATDAFLAEVRAQVAEEALKIMGNFTSDECGDGVYIAIKEFAALLRKGVQS